MILSSKILHGRFLLAFSGALLAAIVSWFQFANVIDKALYDFANETNPLSKPADILIVSIDEKSIDAIGRWPWPREYHVEILRKLTQAKVKSIAYDVIFSEADTEYPETDALLGHAMAKNGHVVLPTALGETFVGGALFTLSPLPALAKAAAGIGHVHIHVDDDGIARSVFLKEGLGHATWHHMSVALYEATYQTPPRFQGIANDAAIAPLTSTIIHRDFQNLIPFVGPFGSINAVSFIDVIKGRIPTEDLENKIIFIGAQAKGLGDITTTSFGQISGVEINANIFHALRTNSLMAPLSQRYQSALSFLIVFFTTLLFTRFKPGLILLGATALTFFVALFSIALLNLQQLWFPPGAVILLIITIYPLWNWLRLHVAIVFMQTQIAQLEQESKILPDFQREKKSGFFKNDATEDNIIRLENAYQQAQHNRELIAKTIDQQTSGVILTDQKGNLLLSNQYAKELLRINTNNILNILKPVFTDQVNPWPQLIEQLFTRGTEFLCEGTLKAPDTDLICRGSLVKLNQPVMLLMLTDVTSLKASEKSRAETLKFLSHDLRAPLTSVLALIESAKTDSLQSINIDLLDNIEGYIRRNLAYADSFIHMARAEYEQDAIMDICDAYSIIDNAVAQLYHSALKLNLHIKINQCDDELWLHCNRVHIERCVVNILDNAIKYSPKNGVISVLLSCNEQFVSIAIVDQGPGIANQDTSSLFERFKQGDASVSGVGLGLHFVKYIVNAHNGFIKLDNNKPTGTRVTLNLPRYEEAPHSL